MRRNALIAYLLLVHGALVLMAWKSDFFPRLAQKFSAPPPAREISDHHWNMLQYHLRMDQDVPDRAVVFIGDSLVQGLYTDAVANPSANFGIGGDTTAGVLARLPAYRSLQRASAVVVGVGLNDLKFRNNEAITANYRSILQTLPVNVPVVMSAVLPVNERVFPHAAIANARIRDLNVSLAALCKADPRCLFADAGGSLVDASGNLAAAFQDGDGVHLNSAGNRVWAGELRHAIEKAQKSHKRGAATGVKSAHL
jgi:lysophospholipase L1-like esterase